MLPGSALYLFCVSQGRAGVAGLDKRPVHTQDRLLLVTCMPHQLPAVAAVGRHQQSTLRHRRLPLQSIWDRHDTGIAAAQFGTLTLLLCIDML